MNRWEIAEILHDARVRLAWGGHWESKRKPWPRTAKEHRAYLHNPDAEMGLMLASADALLAVATVERKPA